VKLPGVSAFVSEREGIVSGIVVGRQVLDEAEILNLAVARGGATARGRAGAGSSHTSSVR